LITVEDADGIVHWVARQTFVASASGVVEITAPVAARSSRKAA
jgi:hypothetical protein